MGTKISIWGKRKAYSDRKTEHWEQKLQTVAQETQQILQMTQGWDIKFQMKGPFKQGCEQMRACQSHKLSLQQNSASRST